MRPADDHEIALHALARGAAGRAHAPYSGFRVGAAVECEGPAEVVLGVNVENSSFGLTCCAERTALFAAVAAGHRRFSAIAIHADTETLVPCGACLQVISELAPHVRIVHLRDGAVVVATLDEMLPFRFTR